MLKPPYIEDSEFCSNLQVLDEIRNKMKSRTPARMMEVGRKSKRGKQKIILSESWVGTNVWVGKKEVFKGLHKHVTMMHKKYHVIDELCRDIDVEKLLPQDWDQPAGHFKAEGVKFLKSGAYVFGKCDDGIMTKFDALLWMKLTEAGLVLYPAVELHAGKSAWFMINLEAAICGIILPRG